MINQQSGARSTSSRKQHKTFVSYVPTRPLALDRHTTTATETGTTATTTMHTLHSAYTSPKSLLGKKNHQTMRYRDECMPLVLPWTPSTTYYDFRVAQLDSRHTLPPCCVKKLLPVFCTLPPYAVSQTKSVCVIEHQCVCALTLTYITCTSTNCVDVPELV